ncbi:DNA polymerase epsilon subunit 3 isoform X3 [Anabrus simplex]|uniref:DNA polymerase epsilon subunit 3 isoform X3 n=1 Tax=Anabrus simplex TaxID=316456 RepID=UPI0035A29CA7
MVNHPLTGIMAERLEDLSLPNTVVTRLAKETLPDGVNVAKEARTAIGKAASVFVLYLTAASSSIAIKNNRKTINGQDVLKAIEETELNKFLEPLEEALGNFRKLQKEKKDAVAKRKLQKKQDDPAMEEEIDKESMELTEDE